MAAPTHHKEVELSVPAASHANEKVVNTLLPLDAFRSPTSTHLLLLMQEELLRDEHEFAHWKGRLGKERIRLQQLLAIAKADLKRGEESKAGDASHGSSWGLVLAHTQMPLSTLKASVKRLEEAVASVAKRQLLYETCELWCHSPLRTPAPTPASAPTIAALSSAAASQKEPPAPATAPSLPASPSASAPKPSPARAASLSLTQPIAVPHPPPFVRHCACSVSSLT
jgi:hypothetical protein